MNISFLLSLFFIKYSISEIIDEYNQSLTKRQDENTDSETASSPDLGLSIN